MTRRILTAYEQVAIWRDASDILPQHNLGNFQLPMDELRDYAVWGLDDDQDESNYPNLEEDVRKNGIRQPVTIATDGQNAYLQDGYHRGNAAQLAGHSHVPAQVEHVHYADEEESVPIGPALRQHLEGRGFPVEARLAFDVQDYRDERHRQELELEKATGGYQADIDDYLARGGKRPITYKEWLRSQRISDAEQAEREGPISNEVYTPDPARWGTDEDAPVWATAHRHAAASPLMVPTEHLVPQQGEDLPPKMAAVRHQAMPMNLPKNLTFKYWPEYKPEYDEPGGGPPSMDLPGVTAHVGDDPEPIGHLSWIGGTDDEWRDEMSGMDYDISGPGEPRGSSLGDEDFDWPGAITNIHVEEPYRRRGVADAMFDHAKQFRPDLHHSKELTDEGYAWSEHEKKRQAATNWRRSLDPDQDPDELLTLYHRTTRPNANKIMQTQSWIPNTERGDYDTPLGSHQTDQHIYFSMRPGGDRSYGPSVVSTQVPRGAIKRDETQFWRGGPNDPQWVRVHVNDLAGRPIVRERSR